MAGLQEPSLKHLNARRKVALLSTVPESVAPLAPSVTDGCRRARKERLVNRNLRIAGTVIVSLLAARDLHAQPAEQWVKEGVRVDVGPLGAPDSTRAQDPNVVDLADLGGPSGYRMYYVGYVGLTTAVLSATSTDGLTWTKEPGIRLQILTPSEYQTIEPEVVLFPDEGGYRMYFAAIRRFFGNWYIGSAFSLDGLNFEVEPGARIEVNTDGFSLAWSPDVVALAEGGYRMYYGIAGSGQWAIASAVSPDGFNWSPESGARIVGTADPAVTHVYDPEVRELPGGGYRMYYVGGDTAGIEQIYSATSSDGLTWDYDPGVRIPVGSPGDLDSSRTASPQIVALPEGLRMYYGGREGAVAALSKHRVLSAFLQDTNHPPVAIAGIDQELAADSACQATAQLDGSASFDPDGDPLTFSWASPSFGQLSGPIVDADFPPGFHLVTLTVNDPQGKSDSDELAVSVADETAPVVVLQGPDLLEVECGTAYEEPGGQALDQCDGALPVDISGTVNSFEPGSYTITYTSADAAGNLGTAHRTVEVVDNLPPDLTAVPANPDTLWPPNHRMVTVTVSGSAIDACSPVHCQLLAVEANEPINGPGAGNTAPDWLILGPATVSLRAERSGLGAGRVYSIAYQCSDGAGNGTISHAFVTVPNSQGN
jgi:Bacterial surface protein, Ig-like domain/PKD domain